MTDAKLAIMLDGVGSAHSRLGNVIASREQAFLALGASLHGVVSRADELVADARSLVETTAGSSVEPLLAELEGHLRDMRMLCGQSGNDAPSASPVLQLPAGATCSGGIAASADSESMARLRENVAMLVRLLEQYSRIVRTLQMLGLSTRIESARLGAEGRGFTTLADDVEALGVSIVEYSSNIRGQAERLEVVALSTDGGMRTMEAAQRSCAHEGYTHVADRLHKLRSHSEHVAHASRELTDILEGMGQTMGEMVASLQFHDIVRQQVEHVEFALAESAEYVRATKKGLVEPVAEGAEATADSERTGQGPGGPGEMREVTGGDGTDSATLCACLGRVVTVQVAQLAQAQELFSRAMATLRQGLATLEDHVLRIRSIAGAARRVPDGTSPLDELVRALEALAEHVAALAGQGGDIGAAMASVADTVTGMTGFLEHIEGVGTEIELIALNASIRAARTGDNGKALGVLALSIQTLSQDAGSQTEAIAERLQSIDEAAAVLRAHAEGYLDTSRVEAVTKELFALIAVLQEKERDAEALLDTLMHKVEGIGSDLRALTDGATMDGPVCAELDEARRELERIAEAGRTDGEEALPLPQALRDILDRYTMESERDVHRHLLGEDAENALFAENAPATSDDGLGSNVELF